MAAMAPQHSDTAEISRVLDVRRWNDPRKSYWQIILMRDPPMPPVKFRYRGAMEKRQMMKFRKRVRDFVIVPVNLAYPIHRLVSPPLALRRLPNAASGRRNVRSRMPARIMPCPLGRCLPELHLLQTNAPGPYRLMDRRRRCGCSAGGFAAA